MPGKGFYERVWALVRRIPPGKVLSYGDVAAALGSPAAARQVGYALAGLGAGGVDREGRLVPWQRVLQARGTVAWRGDPQRGPLQVLLLREEGVTFDAQERVDMRRFRALPEDLSNPEDLPDPEGL